MKCRELYVIITTLLLIIPSITSNAENDETTELQIALITPTGNQLHETTMPLEQAEQLVNQCRNFYSLGESEKTEFINLLSEEIFTQQIDQIALNRILTPPIFNTKIKRDPNQESFASPSATEFMCTVSSGGSGTVFPFFLLPRPRALLFWHGNSVNDVAITTVGSLLRDRGFRAAGGQSGLIIGFIGVGLTYGSVIGRVYALTGYSLITHVEADVIETYYPMNREPSISNPSPAHNTKQVPLSLSTLSFDISDPDNEFMSYTVTTDPYIGIGSGNLKREGRYSISISNLEPSTEYSWTVQVDDGKETVSQTYIFSTVDEKPLISNPIPTDYSSASSDIAALQFTLSDAQGDLMDYTVETSPDIGSKQGTGISNSTITVPVTGLSDDTWYTWYVNVTDGMYWTRESFSFYTGTLGGLIAHWTFDNRDAKDVSGNNYHGSINGVDFVSGKKEFGVEIKENSDRIGSISQKFDDTINTQMTIAAWIFPYEGYTSKNCYIFDNREYSQNGGGFVLEIIKDNKVALILPESGENQIVKSSSSISTQTWTHIAAVYNHDNGIMKMYINGIENNISFTYKSYKKSHYNACIGNNHWADGNWRPFNGILDEIIIYNRELSSTEILNLYNY